MTQTKADSSEPRKLYRLTLAGLARPNTHLRRQVLGFRRQLEAAISERDGAIGVYQASRIHSACLAARQAFRIDKIMAQAGEPGKVTYTDLIEENVRKVVQTGLSHGEWLNYSEKLLRAKEACDRALLALKLDRDKSQDVWDAFYSAPQPREAAKNVASSVPAAAGGSAPAGPADDPLNTTGAFPDAKGGEER